MIPFFSHRTNPIKSVRNVLRFGRSRSSSVEEDERRLVSNPNLAAASSANDDTEVIRRLGNGIEDVESGLSNYVLGPSINDILPEGKSV